MISIEFIIVDVMLLVLPVWRHGLVGLANYLLF